MARPLNLILRTRVETPVVSELCPCCSNQILNLFNAVRKLPVVSA